VKDGLRAAIPLCTHREFLQSRLKRNDITLNRFGIPKSVGF
jgi:hypothetical protein